MGNKLFKAMVIGVLAVSPTEGVRLSLTEGLRYAILEKDTTRKGNHFNTISLYSFMMTF